MSDLIITDEKPGFYDRHPGMYDKLLDALLAQGYGMQDAHYDLGFMEEAIEAIAPLIVREVKAEALEEAADAMDADPSFRDPLRLKSDWLRARAIRARKEQP